MASGATGLGGAILLAVSQHALDGPEHTPPTQSPDLEGAGATLKVKALQGLDIKTMATAHMLGRKTAGAGVVESLSAADARTNMGLGTAATHDIGAVGDIHASAPGDAAAAGATGNTDAKPSHPIPVILDTDIGDDIDDTWALVLLLKSPELNLKLVVGDYGEAQYRARLLAKLLERAGRTNVPVGVGLDIAPRGDGRQAAWIKDYDLKS